MYYLLAKGLLCAVCLHRDGTHGFGDAGAGVTYNFATPVSLVVLLSIVLPMII